MNYGLPYKGSKNRIAKKILDVLPAAPVLYDVFCGGCAITHAAMLSGKYSRVVANDINGMIPHAFEKALRGGFRNEDRWISRDNFQKLYKTDPYVAICFSFGNNLHEYCYARELEPYKRALHYAIFWKDTGPWRELCPETAYALKKAVESEQNRRKRRIGAGRAIVTALKAGLMNGTINPAVMDKPIYKKIRGKYPRVYLQSGWLAERMQSLETLENGERLQSLKRLERLERITDMDEPPVLTVTTGDYRALNFERGGIIYCDPPYMSAYAKGKDYSCEFDAEAFYSWCEAQKLPVYISEYQMPEERFACIAEWDKVTTMAAKTSHVTERLWRPRTQL